MTPQPVLTWVNQQRQERGMEPLEELPKGVSTFPWSLYECPLAVALNVRTGAEFSGQAPELIRQFIRDFDNGKYPELVA